MGREDTICLFDVDGTLTKPKQVIDKNVLSLVVEKLKKKCAVGLVGGSDYIKILEQMGGQEGVEKFDYVFSENGIVAHKQGEVIRQESMGEYMGEEKIQELINFCLSYISKLKLPIKRGNFIEYRTGVINVSPIGRSCAQKERDEFYEYDIRNNIRNDFVQTLRENFADYNLTFSIGGQISVDIFPNGWDKTYCLKFLDKYQNVFFFGDRTEKGGNDYELFTHPRVKGNKVTSPEHTVQLIKETFNINV